MEGLNLSLPIFLRCQQDIADNALCFLPRFMHASVVISDDFDSRVACYGAHFDVAFDPLFTLFKRLSNRFQDHLFERSHEQKEHGEKYRKG